MADIVQVDNPEISAGFHSQVQDSVIQQREFATTADKIIGLLQEEPIEVELTDEVTLSFYPPSDDEYLDIVKFQADGMQIAAKARRFGINPDDEEEAISRIPEAIELVSGARDMLDHLNHILSRLSVDPSFTPDAFKRMPRKYKTHIIATLSKSYSGEINKTRKFRPKSKR